MASTINSTGTSSGVVTTADASGVLNLQGGGNTGISISATGVPTITAPTISGVMTGLGSQSAISYLGSNLSLNNTSLIFSGPNTGSIGAAGQKWLIVSCAAASCTSGAATFENMIYNGSSYIATQAVVVETGNNWPISATSSAIVTLSGAATFTASYYSNNTNAYVNCSSFTGNGGVTASYIYAVRLA